MIINNNKFFEGWKENYSMIIGIIIFSALLLVVIMVPQYNSTDPNRIMVNQILNPPSKSHIFGTDILGRDIVSRIAVGGRGSLLIGIEVTLSTALLGSVIALLAGYYEKFDAFVMRIMDIMMTFPSLLQ